MVNAKIMKMFEKGLIMDRELVITIISAAYMAAFIYLVLYNHDKNRH